MPADLIDLANSATDAIDRLLKHRFICSVRHSTKFDVTLRVETEDPALNTVRIEVQCKGCGASHYIHQLRLRPTGLSFRLIEASELCCQYKQCNATLCGVERVQQ